jgi:hypothetical protein
MPSSSNNRGSTTITKAAHREKLVYELRGLSSRVDKKRDKRIVKDAREEIDTYHQHCGGNIGYRTVSASVQTIREERV